MRGGACAPSHSVFHETICFSQEMIRGICSMDDFYKATGIAALVKEKILPIEQAENEVFEEMTDAEHQEILRLMEKYLTSFRSKIMRLS